MTLSLSQGAPGPSVADPTDPEAIARVMLEKSPLLIYITDLNYKVVLINRAAREATGYDTVDCPDIDSLLERFYPDPAYRGIVESIHGGWQRNEHIRGTELVVQCKDGLQRTISWSTSRLKIGRRPAIGYIAMGVDVTTRRSLEQWVSLLQRSLQHLDEGVVLTDPLGGILAWSDGAKRLLGYGEEVMQGRNLSELFLRAERTIVAASVDRAIEADGRFEGELEFEKEDGGTSILVLRQARLDGDGGAPLARLSVLSAPGGSDAAEPSPQALQILQERISGLTAELEAERNERAAETSLIRGLQEGAEADAAQHESHARKVADLTERLLRTEAELEAARDALDARPAEDAREAEQSIVLARREADEAALRAEDARKQLSKATKKAVDAEGKADGLRKRVEELEAALRLAEQRARQAEEEVIAAAEAAALAAEAEQAVSGRDEEVRAALEARIRALEEELEAERAEVSGIQRRAAEERSEREESHRAALAAVQDKAAEDRRALEEQLSRDILAAEERAETERARLEERYEQQRLELEAQADIARAEAESDWRARVTELEDQAGRAVAAQARIGALPSAVVAADTEGRVTGWSVGAAELDGRRAELALGRHIHRDVLQLEGVDWKNLFGRAVIAGRIEARHVLVDTQGRRRSVELRVELVRDEGGRPAGVTEVIRPLVEPAVLRDRAAAGFTRLAAPALHALLDQVRGGVATQKRAGIAIDELLSVARLVSVGAGAAELEEEARRLDLKGLIEAAAEDRQAEGRDWASVRAAAQDLVALSEGVAGTGLLEIRWNELVERSLHLAAASDPRSTDPDKHYEDAPVVRVPGGLVVPLLASLLRARAPLGASWSVHTAVDPAGVRLEVRGAVPEESKLPLIEALAREAGGDLLAQDGALVLSLPREPEDAGPQTDLEMPLLSDAAGLSAAGLDEDDDDDDDDAAVLESGAVEMMDESDDGDLMLMLGEDSALLEGTEPSVDYVPVSATGKHPRVEEGEATDHELEGAFGAVDRVSPGLLASAHEMDDFVENNLEDLDALEDFDGDGPADPASTDPQHTASPEVVREMTKSAQSAKKKKRAKKKK